MHKRLRSSAFGIALATLPFLAMAQQGTKEYPECTRQPTDSDIAAAKGAFQAGQVSFNEADYDRAITYWEDAYRRDCTAHAMLLNLARAYELDGNLRQAVVALETWLARNPSSPQRDQINKRLEALKQKVATLPPPSETTGAAETTPPPGTPPPNTTATGLPPDAPPSGSKPILPLLVAGGGGVLAVVGGVMYLAATADYNDAKDACGGKTSGCAPEVREAGDDAVNRQRVSAVISVVGLAIAAGGIVWYVLSPPEPASEAKKPPRRRTAVAPTVGPGFAGVSLSGTF